MLNIGIIGAARVASYAMIAPAAANPRTRVVAIAARDPARARAYAAEHGIARVHADYAALVADPAIDLVYVATPPAFHLAHARLAIAAGKPVLVEKPFAMHAGEAETLLDEAEAAGVAIFEAMHARHHPVWPLLADLIPRIGRLHHVDAVFDVAVSTDAAEFRWEDRLGGGALMDLGVYPLAWARGVAGEPLAVNAATMVRQRNADAAFSARLQFADDVTASVSADMRAPVQARLTLVGRDGSLIIDNPMSVRAHDRVRLTDRAGNHEFVAAGSGTFDRQLAALVATLVDGVAFPLAPRDPMGSMRAIDMVRSAAAD